MEIKLKKIELASVQKSIKTQHPQEVEIESLSK
jgi:hypothetical protein